MKFSKIIDAKKQPFQAWQSAEFDERLNILLNSRKPLSAHSGTVVSSQATIRQGESAKAFSIRSEMLNTAKTKSGIYAIRNTLNGKVYVGSSVNIPSRWANHKYKLKLS